MQTIGRSSRIVAPFVMALAVALCWGTTAVASDTAQITIHKATCPTGAGNAIFEQCHGNHLSGVTFTITLPETSQTYVTDANGSIGPITIPSDTDVTIAEDASTLAQYLGAFVYCSDTNTGTVLFDSDLGGGNSVTLNVFAGTLVACDWYDITPAASGGSTTTTTLPTTGTGSPNGPISPALAMLVSAAAALLIAGASLRKRNGCLHDLH